MLGDLERLVAEVSALNSKLILLVNHKKSSKINLLHQIGRNIPVNLLNVGLVLGQYLAALPKNKRTFSAGEFISEFVTKDKTHQLFILDNIEILFEKSLQINPLDLIKKIAHSKLIIAVWPGELKDGRLIYAEVSHPEYRDYSCEGLVVLEL